MEESIHRGSVAEILYHPPAHLVRHFAASIVIGMERIRQFGEAARRVKQDLPDVGKHFVRLNVLCQTSQVVVKLIRRRIDMMKPAANETGYVTGIEPGTGFPNTRSIEREQGRVPKLEPREYRDFHLAFEITKK